MTTWSPMNGCGSIGMLRLMGALRASRLASDKALSSPLISNRTVEVG